MVHNFLACKLVSLCSSLGVITMFGGFIPSIEEALAILGPGHRAMLAPKKLITYQLLSFGVHDLDGSPV